MARFRLQRCGSRARGTHDPGQALYAGRARAGSCRAARPRPKSGDRAPHRREARTRRDRRRSAADARRPPRAGLPVLGWRPPRRLSRADRAAGKLARPVLAADPPPPLVARLEQAYLSSDGDLPAVYRALIAAPESWDPAQRKFRTPYEWTIASMRALEGQAFRPPAAIGILSQIGQPFWRPGSPAGYDVTTASWLAPDALYRRIEAAAR